MDRETPRRSSMIGVMPAPGAMAAVMIVGLAGLVGGCGKSDEGAKTAKPKFEVADDSVARKPAASASGDTPMPGDPAAGSPNRQSIKQPPSISGDRLDEPEKIEVPDGTPEELLAFIGQLGQRAGTTQLQVQQGIVPISRLQDVFEALLEAADKILALKPDKKTLKQAINIKAGALSMLSRLSPDQPWNKQLREFGKTLAADAEPEKVLEGKAILCGILASDVSQRRSPDVDGLIARIGALLEDPNRNDTVFGVSYESMLALRQIGFDEKAWGIYKKIADAFQDHPNAALAKQSEEMREQLRMTELKIEMKASDVALKKEGSEDSLLEAIAQAINGPAAGGIALEKAIVAVGILEQSGNYATARKICEMIQAVYKESSDVEAQSRARQAMELAFRRLDLVGKPLSVAGKQFDGAPFDYAHYRGKVVLIAFFSIRSLQCRKELTTVKAAFEKYHDKGFDVIGVDVDRNQGPLGQFLSQLELPWVTIVNADLVKSCGVELVPFLVLLDQQGNVLELWVQGNSLEDRLAGLLGPASAKKPAAPRGGAASGKQSSMWRRRLQLGAAGSVVGLRGDWPGDARAARPNPESPSMPPAGPRKETGQDEDEADELEGVDETMNPYLAPARMKAAELVTFLFDMEEKPKSIRRRPGFADAVIDAAERILASDAGEKYQLIAAEAKFSALHETACLGDTEADRRLAAFVDQMANDKRPVIARRVAFYQLERRALNTDQLDVTSIPPLLAELNTYLAAQKKLQSRHLRLASLTVRAINRLESAEEREKYFTQFGKLFAASSDRQLAGYGKNLVGGGKDQPADLVGKPLELEGLTALGARFDWASYRGKVVLVDFWATWCGPCLREMPHVRARYEKLAASNFDVVAISLDADLEALAKFLKEKQVPWTNLIGDEARALASKYGVRGIPTMFLVDKEGTVVAVGNRISELDPQIEKLIDADQAEKK